MVVQNILIVKGLDHMTKKHKAYNKSVSAQIERKARRAPHTPNIMPIVQV